LTINAGKANTRATPLGDLAIIVVVRLASIWAILVILKYRQNAVTATLPSR